jgi:hypothetical protein
MHTTIHDFHFVMDNKMKKKLLDLLHSLCVNFLSFFLSGLMCMEMMFSRNWKKNFHAGGQKKQTYGKHRVRLCDNCLR